MTILDIDDTAGSTVAFLVETVSLDFQVSSEVHDTTTLGDDWKESTPGLLGGDTVKHSMFYNNANSTGTYAFMMNRLGVAGTLKWSDGTRTTTVETVVTQVSTPISVGDMIKLDVTHQLTGAVVVT